MRSLPDESIDLAFIDPPYFMQTSGDLHRTNGEVFDGVKDKWDKFVGMDEYEKFTYDYLKECRRVLKKDGAIWIIGSFQNIYTVGHIMLKLGFWILNDVIWSKPNAVPNFTGSRFQNSHETLLWCSKSKGSKYQFNYKTMKALNGGNIVTCPYCGHQFDFDDEQLHTFQQQVIEVANRYIGWVAEDAAWDRVNELAPEIRAEVIAIIDAVLSKEGGVENITEKSLEDFTNYVRCPHCWGKVYQANKLLQDAPGEGGTTEEPLTDTPKAEQPDTASKEADSVTSMFFKGLSDKIS